MVIGEQPFQSLAEHYRKPIVITGFEPLDILQSIHLVLRQINDSRNEVENQYTRVVRQQGNPVGLEAIHDVFELGDFFELRGLGSIGESGVRIRDKYADYDAERRFSVPNLHIADPEACQCGEVLTGAIRPWECALFGNKCTPQTPMGALMVSSEGSCAAYYNFGDVNALLEKRAQHSASA